MNKLYFTPILIIGALLVFSLLPIFNFHVDQWRVLHSDYQQAYKGLNVNKSFLKTSYLIENNDKFDTLFMGSSRIGHMNAKLVSKKAYNMTYSSGLVGTHLNNLKTLIKNDLKVKSIWLGINDYVIWKKPISVNNDFLRRPYTNSFFAQLDLYTFYLYKKISKRDINIFMGEYQLEENSQITDPSKIIAYLTNKSNRLARYPKKWQNQISNEKSTLLGYKDNTYRVDEAIQEIKEIKKICNDNNIELVVFMFPIYYKTMLQYNQYKIEEFKTKLSSVIPFHDFYTINKISLNELNWFNDSHFIPQVGDVLIEKIIKKENLVSRINLETHLKSARNLVSKIIEKPSNTLYQFNANIHLGTLDVLFDLKDDSYKYITNKYFNLDLNENFIKIIFDENITEFDPILILNNTHTSSSNVILHYEINSSINDKAQIFYKKTKNSKYNKENSIILPIKKGDNKFNILIPAAFINNELRVDLISKKGVFEINDFKLYNKGL